PKADAQRDSLIARVRQILFALPSLTMLSYTGAQLRRIVRMDSFVQTDISADQSKRLFGELLARHVLELVVPDRSAEVAADFSPSTDLSFLFEGWPGADQFPLVQEQRLAEIRAVLLGLPRFVEPDYFVSPDITIDLAGNVLDLLKKNNVVDEDGTVLATFHPTMALPFLAQVFTDEARRSAQVDQVRRMLVQFYNAIYENDLNAVTFDLQRVSARASAAELSHRMFAGGVDALLTLDTQNAPVVPKVPFDRLSPNVRTVAPPTLFDGVQVDFEGPYGLYHWELFLHAPLL